MLTLDKLICFQNGQMHWPIFVTGLESIVCRRPGPGESGAKGIFKKNGIKVMSSQVFISTKA